jgi:hypothetical protein
MPEDQEGTAAQSEPELFDGGTQAAGDDAYDSTEDAAPESADLGEPDGRADAGTAASPHGDSGYTTLDTPEAVADYLRAQGYTVGRPGDMPSRPAAPAPAPAQQPTGVLSQQAQREALQAQYAARYAETFDPSEQFRIMADYNAAVQKLEIGAIEKQTARADGMARLPQVEKDFLANGYPKEAAAHYVDILSSMEPEIRAMPQAQGIALQMAVGRATLTAARSSGPNPGAVRVPKGEGGAVGGARNPTARIDARELAALKAAFPDYDFSPANLAKLRQEGLFDDGKRA